MLFPKSFVIFTHSDSQSEHPGSVCLWLAWHTNTVSLVSFSPLLLPVKFSRLSWQWHVKHLGYTIATAILFLWATLSSGGFKWLWSTVFSFVGGMLIFLSACAYACVVFQYYIWHRCTFLCLLVFACVYLISLCAYEVMHVGECLYIYFHSC